MQLLSGRARLRNILASERRPKVGLRRLSAEVNSRSTFHFSGRNVIQPNTALRKCGERIFEDVSIAQSVWLEIQTYAVYISEDGAETRP